MRACVLAFTFGVNADWLRSCSAAIAHTAETARRRASRKPKTPTSRPPADTLNANPSPSANANPTPNDQHMHVRSPRSPFRSTSASSRYPADTGPPPAYSTPAALDVAVVIAMPAAQHARPYSYSYSQYARTYTPARAEAFAFAEFTTDADGGRGACAFPSWRPRQRAPRGWTAL